MNIGFAHPLNPIYQLRRLYNWTLEWADHPSAVWALGALSTVEGIFFPIPIDPFLLALSASKPKNSLKYAAIATVTSVIGGTIGYFVGVWFWDMSREFFFNYVMSPSKFEIVISKFQDNAFLAIFIAGFTPIPYKVFAIAGGVANIGLSTFIIASLLGRSIRFFVIGILFYFWGKEIKALIEKHFNLLSVILAVGIITFIMYFKL